MIMYNPQLDIFIWVADAGSLNKATETMYITPSAVDEKVSRNLIVGELLPCINC